eukprot:7214452-Prorocentrum_lima.AAC.1
MVQSTFQDVLTLDTLTPTQELQACLPLRLGGVGLTEQVRLAPAAWVGSWANCLPHVAARGIVFDHPQDMLEMRAALDAQH